VEEKCLLDFARVDVRSACDDDVVFAIEEIQASVGPEASDVAGV
jgi:hypothetical protein